MAQTFNCPSCGAMLEYPGGTAQTMKCTYCGNNVAAPVEFWQEAKTAQTTRQWGKYLIIFLVITVGIPTCLGLLGAILGIGGSIFGIIIQFLVIVIQFIVQFFTH